MSQDSNLKHENFTFTKVKKRGKKKNTNILNNEFVGFSDTFDVDKDAALRRINGAKEEILASDLLSSVLALLREGLAHLDEPEIKEIICLGLGHVSDRIVSRYQLALLLCLKSHYDVNVYVHDPIFSTVDKQILLDLGFIVLDENREGKYQARLDGTTIFYLPHCPKQLTNNLLWSNWTLNLRNCVIIANSFSNLLESLSKRSLAENGSYIINISPYVVELAIINTFKYYDVFNDTAIHVFPLKKLTLIPEDFWTNCSEPAYSSESIEFIVNKIVNVKL